MILKSIIVILFIAILVSLFTGLRFLVKDLGDSKRRLFNSLGMRVTLAALLIVTIAYGAATGQIGSQAPWDKQLHPDAAQTKPQHSNKP
jgi:succinate dehydrogenase/fumarate reductase cytochrome b subunit|tara:strand:+ start:476 stop:742 length:267 start_codon:yes stop_codon:yes gene_type:complete